MEALKKNTYKMELPSNKLNDVIHYFHHSLDTIFGKNEVDSFVKEICFNILNINNLISDKKTNIFLLESELDAFNKILQRLKKQEPLQYILGSSCFYGIDFKVTPAVLIPRPETEELVALVIKSYKAKPEKEKYNNLHIIDIGTGSGCIALTLKKEIPEANIAGLDISDEALIVARENATVNKLDVSFSKYDVLSNSPLPKTDIIVSNPPYITATEKTNMNSNVLDYEPHTALFVTNNDPLEFYKAISDKAISSLNTGGMLFFELNPLYANEVYDYVVKSGFKQVELHKDINGKSRILKAVL